MLKLIAGKGCIDFAKLLRNYFKTVFHFKAFKALQLKAAFKIITLKPKSRTRNMPNSITHPCEIIMPYCDF